MESHKKVLGAIDVGTNAVRLKLVESLGPGHYDVLLNQRDAIRPGEGVFATGSMPEPVIERLVQTLARYVRLCKQYNAIYRAVATSAFREANNQTEILERLRQEADLDLQVISGKEEARLICLGVLAGTPPEIPSVVVDIGGGSTEVVVAYGAKPTQLWSLGLGCVQLTEMFSAQGIIKRSLLNILRGYVQQTLSKALLSKLPFSPAHLIGSSGTIRALVNFARGASGKESGPATAQQVSEAVENIARMDLKEREKIFDTRRSEVIVAGAVILEGIMKHWRFPQVLPTSRGLRDGLLLDVEHRAGRDDHAELLYEAALDIGRRFHFNEAHASQVSRLAVALFDQAKELANWSPGARNWLLVAGLLDDIGYLIHRQKHHLHSAYLVESVDFPGLSQRDKQVVAAIIRSDLKQFQKIQEDALEYAQLAVLLRIADALDRGHRQAVLQATLVVNGDEATLTLQSSADMGLEMWTIQQLTPCFEYLFGKRLLLPQRDLQARTEDEPA